jgi:hypothetical protein
MKQNQPTKNPAQKSESKHPERTPVQPVATPAGQAKSASSAMKDAPKNPSGTTASSQTSAEARPETKPAQQVPADRRPAGEKHGDGTQKKNDHQSSSSDSKKDQTRR